MKPQKVLRSLGKYYEFLHRLPVLGEPLVRGVTRSLARLAFNTPFSGFKRCESIEETRELLLRMCARAAIPIEIVEEERDRFVFNVLSCPYGYCRPDQMGVCDASMDMDRTFFKLCGVDLIIEESIVSGAPKCRILMCQT